MKLRIRGNSVRLRLNQGEVAQFGETGLIKETVEFGPGSQQQLVYTLALSDDENPKVSFENNQLTVYLPKRLSEEWVQTEQISIRAEQSIGDEKKLSILVEKDFVCLEKRAGDEDTDSFPHPMAGRFC